MSTRSISLPEASRLRAPEFELRVRVYYEDTDAGGIVYHANYLRYFERARTDWLRFGVRDRGIDYCAPARLDDELIVDVHVLEARRASMRLAQLARKPGRHEPLATASLRIAAIDRGTGRPAGFPRWLTDRFRTPH